MFTRVQHHDRKTGDEKKRLLNTMNPFKGWFMSELEDITDQLEEEEAGKRTADTKKADAQPCFSHAVKIKSFREACVAAELHGSTL